MMGEVKNTSYNMEKTSGMKFPDCIPVLFLLAKRNIELIPGWEGLHRNIITEQVISEVLEEHYELLGADERKPRHYCAIDKNQV